MFVPQLLTVAALLLVVVVTPSVARSADRTADATTITIDGEFCNGCLKKIRGKLFKVKGVL